MIESSVAAWLLFGFIALLSSAAGCAVASCWRWSEPARASRLPLFWGLGLGPLLLGLAVVLVLSVAPGASHRLHLLSVCALLVCPVVLASVRGRWRKMWAGNARPLVTAERLLIALLAAWFAALLVDAMFLPLMQNDSLEYTIVGRAIFESRSLADYPQIHPEASRSGFFGPWTHPPLYVALIYLANVIQGHADAPGLMRLWAPWALISAVGVIYGLGAIATRMTGLVAGLLLVSTPLLFLGADSALLDALPLLGLLIAAGALLGINGPSPWRGAAAGLGLGLALWTHSQAVLFVLLVAAALVLQDIRRPSPARFVEAVVLFALTALLACWPYLRNLGIFGSLISDNPLVFALPSQAWPDYFRIGRGVDGWPAIIQYGWLKGWWALEAYGFTFWIMLLALALHGWRARQLEDAAAGVYRLSLFLLGCYLLGVIASTAIRLDLMIKNERYMLAIVPFACLLAAFGLQRLFSMRFTVSASAQIAFVSLMMGLLGLLVSYRFGSFGLAVRDIGLPLEEKAELAPEYRAARYLAENAPVDALVLSLKPADMYYAGRRMVSYLDPRLVPFYGARAAQEALHILRDLGVVYVHVPSYGLPPLYNSHLHEILRSPRWATLCYQANGYQIYELRPSGKREGAAVDLLGGQVAWTRTAALKVGGRKALSSLDGDARRIDIRQPSVAGLPLGMFHRDWSTSLTAASPGAPGHSPPGLPVNGSQEYAIDLALEGHGLVHVWLRQFGERGLIEASRPGGRAVVLLSDLTLGGGHPERRFSRRVRMLPGTRYVTLTLEHVGASQLRVRSAALVPLETFPQ